MLVALPVFAQQPDYSLVPYRQGNLWGYANTDKSIVIRPAFDEAHWFVAGYAVVRKGARFGYINTSGKLVIPFKFYTAKSFRYGYFDRAEKHTADGKLVQNQDTVLFAGASFKANGVESCIDTKGRRMSKCPAINENSVADNTQAVTIVAEKSYGLVNNANLYDKLVDDYKLPGDNSTYYIGIKNNLYGVINNTFDVVIPFEYTSLKVINISGTSYLQGQKNGKFGIYKGNGSVYVPLESTRLQYVKANNGDEYFIEAKEGKVALRDLGYHVLIGSNYSDISYDDEGGFIVTGADKMKGYYFLNNKMIEPRYTDVRLTRGGKFLEVKTRSGKMGYVSNQGTEFFDE